LSIRKSRRGNDPQSVRTESLGGHPIIDFVNTVSWRLEPGRRRDELTTFGVLLAWTKQAGLLQAADVRRLTAQAARDDKAAERTLDAVRALREQLYRVLVEPAGSHESELDALQHTFVAALSRADLTLPLPLQWRSRVEQPNDLLWLLALAAIELLSSRDVHHVRQCAGAGCGWLFVDHSRNQSRRWCSSSSCGNRHRVKSHYARRKTERSVQ
jgi:predicted RNA-binding Zn ribbon-like protein